MSLLGSVLGSVLANQLGGQAHNSPLHGVLGSLLGGGMGGMGAPAGGGGGLGGALGGALGGLLGGGQQPAPMQQPMGGGPGGLMGLLGLFQQSGLGHVTDSWVGTGANQAISPQQLEQVFGQQQVQQMAQQANMHPQDLLSQLSQILPQVVDRMTPNGQLPPADAFGGGQAGGAGGFQDTPPMGGGKTYRT